MTKRENIDKPSVLYGLIKVFFMKWVHDFFYRKQKVVDAHRVPGNQSVIIAPNHQNALMDALSFVMGLRYQTVFLARSDIFKGKLIIQLLTFMKILPIFRIRDGISSLQKNEEIFDITVNILKRKQNPLLLFPEGNHGDKRRLRPLVKGIFRIAFQAQEHFGDKPGVKIIPAGLDYTHYYKFRQTQLVIFGEPIEVNQYWAAYKENPSVAINQLREHLAAEMRKVMIDIQTDEHYHLYMGLRYIVGPAFCRSLNLNPNDLYEKFLSDKKMIAALDRCLEKEPKKIDRIHEVFDRYSRLRDQLNLRDWVPAKKKYAILLNVLLILLSPVVWPLVILGLFNNWVHFFIPTLMKKGIKDEQFISTIVWAAGMALIFFYYLILGILAILFLPTWWLVLLYIFTLGSSGIFALGYRNFLIKSWARIRYSWQMRKQGSTTQELKKDYDLLLSETQEILEDYKEV